MAKIVDEPKILRYEFDPQGKKIPVYSAKVETTVTNTKTGQEYNSDAEAMQDVQNPDTSTKSEHIRRDVKVTVESIPLGTATNISD